MRFSWWTVALAGGALWVALERARNGAAAGDRGRLEEIPLDALGHIRSDNPLVGRRSTIDPSVIFRADHQFVYLDEVTR